MVYEAQVWDVGYYWLRNAEQGVVDAVWKLIEVIILAGTWFGGLLLGLVDCF